MKNAELLKILPTLTAEQWKITKAWAERYKAEKLVEDETAAALLDVINAALGTRVPYERLKVPWIVSSGNIAWFMNSTFPKLNKVKRRALLVLFVSMVMDDLKRRGVPLRFGTIWVNMVRVPELVEASFPGYCASGLGFMITKAMERK